MPGPMMTNARRRGVGKAGIDRGTENVNLRQLSVQCSTLCPDNPELWHDCKTVMLRRLRRPEWAQSLRPRRSPTTTAKSHSPIRYVADLFGADTDSERAIRWLIALMVLCCDPLAIALTAAASARRRTAV